MVFYFGGYTFEDDEEFLENNDVNDLAVYTWLAVTLIHLYYSSE